MPFSRFLLLAAAMLLAFDVAASVGSIALGFPYASATYGSIIMYVGFGFLAALRYGFSRGVLLGALLGLIDATAGWAISWAIGPGQVAASQFSFGAWALTLVLVVAMGAVFGLVGTGAAMLVRRARAT